MSTIIEKKKKRKKKDLFAMQFNSDPKADMDSFNCMMSEKVDNIDKKPYTLRENELTNTVLDAMVDSNTKQDDAYVGPFWYDPNNKEVYGNIMTLAIDKPFYTSNGKNVRTGNALHKNIWKKEEQRGKDKRFSGDYKLKPRGRVFEVENDGFKVYTGKWIEQHPEAKEEIIDVFQLPKDNTEFIQDEHWDIGHGWSEDIYLGESTMNENTNKNFVIEAIETSKKFYNIDRNGLYSTGHFFFDLIDYCEENDIWVDWRENKDRQGNFHLTMFKIELDRQQKEDLLKEFPKLKDELRPERKSR